MESKKEPYKCEWCGKQYEVYHDLDRHILIHGPDDPRCPFECVVCGETFASDKDLQSHASLHDSMNSENEYFCDMCDKICQSEAELDEHILSHDFNETFNCTICKKSFTLESDLERHTMLSHDESETTIKDYKCKICGKLFSTKKGLSRHVGNHKEFGHMKTMAGVNCPICNNYIAWKKNLRRHMELFHKHPVKPASIALNKPTKIRTANAPSLAKRGNVSKMKLSCKICARTFKNTKNLSQHMDMHKYKNILAKYRMASKKTKCNHCYRSFLYRQNLNRHIRDNHTKRESNNFACEICDLSFDTESELDEHIKDHLVNPTNNNFKCKICSAVFVRIRTFFAHMKRLHKDALEENEAKFFCQTCGKTFESDIALTNHTRWHLYARQEEAKKDKIVQSFQGHSKKVNQDAIRNDKLKYFCKICGKTYGSARGLSNHKRLHVRNGELNFDSDPDSQEPVPFCEICQKTFESNVGLSNHMRKHTREDGLKKQVSENEVQSKPDDDRDNSDAFFCKMCHKHFANRSSLQRHVRLRHVKIHGCDMCEESFETKAGLEQHMMSHYGETPQKIFTCEICNKVFNDSKGLASHFRSHRLGNLPIAIPDNTAETSQKEYSVSKSPEKKYFCSKCDEQFETFQGYQSHLRTHQNRKLLEDLPSLSAKKPRLDSTEKKCPICGKILKNAAGLGSHMNSHKSKIQSVSNTETSPLQKVPVKFRCKQCGKNFLRKSNLNSHVQTAHIGRVESFSCDICDKTFNLKSELNVHIASHSKFDCKICGKSYNKRSFYTTHMKTHNPALSRDEFIVEKDARKISVVFEKDSAGMDTKSYRCVICKKGYQEMKDIQRHVQTCNENSDSEEEILRCSICDGLFDSKSKLDQHVKKNHSETAIQSCKICGKFVASALSLEIHMRKHKLEIESGENDTKEYVVRLTADGKKRYQCKKCGDTYIHKESVLKHFESHTSMTYGRFVCCICLKLFPQKITMLEHMKTAHSKVYTCYNIACKKTFSTLDQLKAHQANCDQITRCEICKRMFSKKDALRRHMQNHFKKDEESCNTENSHGKKKDVRKKIKKNFKCRICKKMFEAKQDVRQHIKRKHKIKILEYRNENGLLPYKIVKLNPYVIDTQHTDCVSGSNSMDEPLTVENDNSFSQHGDESASALDQHEILENTQNMEVDMHDTKAESSSNSPGYSGGVSPISEHVNSEDESVQTAENYETPGGSVALWNNIQTEQETSDNSPETNLTQLEVDELDIQNPGTKDMEMDYSQNEELKPDENETDIDQDMDSVSEENDPLVINDDDVIEPHSPTSTIETDSQNDETDALSDQRLENLFSKPPDQDVDENSQESEASSTDDEYISVSDTEEPDVKYSQTSEVKDSSLITARAAPPSNLPESFPDVAPEVDIRKADNHFLQKDDISQESATEKDVQVYSAESSTSDFEDSVGTSAAVNWPYSQDNKENSQEVSACENPDTTGHNINLIHESVNSAVNMEFGNATELEVKPIERMTTSSKMKNVAEIHESEKYPNLPQTNDGLEKPTSTHSSGANDLKISKKTFKCKKCGRCFKSKDIFIRHVKLHKIKAK